MHLKRKGLYVEKYIVQRNYRGNAFDIVDMGFDTYPFFTKYNQLIDTELRELEIKMRKMDEKDKMTKFTDESEKAIYMPPIFDVCSIKEMKLEAAANNQMPVDYSGIFAYMYSIVGESPYTINTDVRLVVIGEKGSGKDLIIDKFFEDG